MTGCGAVALIEVCARTATNWSEYYQMLKLRENTGTTFVF